MNPSLILVLFACFTAWLTKEINRDIHLANTLFQLENGMKNTQPHTLQQDLRWRCVDVKIVLQVKV